MNRMFKQIDEIATVIDGCGKGLSYGDCKEIAERIYAAEYRKTTDVGMRLLLGIEAYLDMQIAGETRRFNDGADCCIESSIQTYKKVKSYVTDLMRKYREEKK